MMVAVVRFVVLRLCVQSHTRSFDEFCANSTHAHTRTILLFVIIVIRLLCMLVCASSSGSSVDVEPIHERGTIKLINNAIYSETDGKYCSCFARQPIKRYTQFKYETRPCVCVCVSDKVSMYYVCLASLCTHFDESVYAPSTTTTHGERTHHETSLIVVVHFPLPCTKIIAARLVVKLFIILCDWQK